MRRQLGILVLVVACSSSGGDKAASGSAAPASAPAPPAPASVKPASPPVDAAQVALVPAAPDARVAAAPGAIQIVTSIYRACAVARDGRALCWGLGHATPTPLAIAGKVKTIRLDQDGGCALVDDGTVSCWKGDAAPVAQAGVSGATALWIVGDTGCAAVAGGALHCWGTNAKQFEGQTDVVAIDWWNVLHGDGTVSTAGDSTSKLKPVPGLSDAVEIGSGCARKKDGTAVCWGDNNSCRLGLAFDGDGSTKPVPMKGITDAVQVIDLGKPCVVTAAGALMCQGAYDGEYEYGCGDRPPREIPGISGIASVASGAPVCAIGKDGGVLCFGKGVLSEKSMKAHPATAVPGVTGVTQLAVGDGFACALDGAGAVWCWGDNAKGSLGTGDTAAQPAPVKVALGA